MEMAKQRNSAIFWERGLAHNLGLVVKTSFYLTTRNSGTRHLSFYSRLEALNYASSILSLNKLILNFLSSPNK
jgi:hypothetical protein